MKVRNYEKKTIVNILILMTIIIEISTLIILCTNKVYNYKKITGIVVKNNLVLVIVNKKERKIIYSNQKLYLKDKKEKYSIEEDRGIVLRKDKSIYYELLLKINTKNKYKTNDSISLILPNKKYPMIEMFKMILRSD